MDVGIAQAVLDVVEEISTTRKRRELDYLGGKVAEGVAKLLAKAMR